MSLHEWLKFNKLDDDEILYIERAYFNGTYHFVLCEKHLAILWEWLADPERNREFGGCIYGR